MELQEAPAGTSRVTYKEISACCQADSAVFRTAVGLVSPAVDADEALLVQDEMETVQHSFLLYNTCTEPGVKRQSAMAARPLLEQGRKVSSASFLCCMCLALP